VPEHEEPSRTRKRRGLPTRSSNEVSHRRGPFARGIGTPSAADVFRVFCKLSLGWLVGKTASLFLQDSQPHGRSERTKRKASASWKETTKFQEHLRKRWRKSSILRSHWRCIWENAEAKRRLDRHRPTEQSKPDAAVPFDSLWAAGDMDTPVSIKRLADTIDRACDDFQSRTQFQISGAYAAGLRLQGAQAGSLMVSDPSLGRLPDIARERTCAEMHPGACVREFGECREAILVVVCNLNTLCSHWSKWELIGKVFHLEAHFGDGQFSKSLDVMLCDARFASPIMQVYCPLRSTPLTDGSEGHAASRDDTGRLAMSTSFGLICKFLSRHPEWGIAERVSLQDMHVDVADARDLDVLRVRPADGLDKKLCDNGSVVEIYPALRPKSRRCGRTSARDRILAAGEGDPVDEEICCNFATQ